MKNSSFLFLPLLLIQLIACESNTDLASDESAISKYELVKADSIIVDYMENISILDFDTERNIVLGFNSRSGDYIEFDLSGKILNEVNLIGEGPNDHGKNSYQVNYIGGGKVGVAAIGRYFIYNEDWEVENKVDFDFSGSYAVTAGGGYITYGKPQAKDVSNPYLSISSVSFYVSKKEDLKEAHLFQLNTQTGEGNYYHYFPDSSVFLASDKFYLEMMDAITSYNYEKQVLDVIHRGEAVLYRYDISTATPTLISSYRFDYDNPNGMKGVTFEEAPAILMSGGGLFLASNQKLSGLFSFEDKQLITYMERHPMSDLISPNEQDVEKLREFYNTPTKSWAYLIKDGKRISENMPIGSPRIALQLGKGRFLSNRYVDPGIERDTQLYYIYELREVGG